MKITIEVIPHSKQRYDTIGDWYWTSEQELGIRVSEMPDRRFEALVAVHELVEALLCRADGVTSTQVDHFDEGWLQLQPLSSPPLYSEPGEDPRAPYHEQHVCAEIVERIVAQAMSVHWPSYARLVDSVLDFPGKTT